MADNTVQQPVWCVQTPIEAYDARQAARDNLHYSRFMNPAEYSRERHERFRAMGLTPPFPRGMRFDAFVNLPWLSVVP